MTPAFGFSAGDFISAIQLINQITNALKSSHGASEEYRSLLRELKSLKSIFEYLSTIRSLPNVNPNYTQLIQAHASVAHETLVGSLKLVSKYDAKLGEQGSTKWYRGASRKAQWAVSYTKDIDKLRLAIGTQLQALNLLLNIDERDEWASSAQTLSTFSQQLLSLDAQVTRSQDENKSGLELIHLNVEKLSRMIQTSINAHSDVTSQILQYSQLQNDATKSIIQAITQLQEDQRDLKQLIIGMIQRPPQSSKPEAAGKHLSQSGSRNRISHDTEQVEQMPGSIPCRVTEPWDWLGAIGFTVSELLKWLSDLVRGVRTVLAHIVILYHLGIIAFKALQSAIPRAPLLLSGNCIIFTDALRRVHKLQFEHFRYWRVFEAFLECRFQGLPGEKKVLSRDYRIVDSQIRSVVISKTEWPSSVFPGQRLSMSIAMKALQASKNKCPKPGCNGSSSVGADALTITCQVCGLEYLMESSKSRRSIRLETEDMEKVSPRVNTFGSNHSESSYVFPGSELLADESMEILQFCLVHIAPQQEALVARSSTLRKDFESPASTSRSNLHQRGMESSDISPSFAVSQARLMMLVARKSDLELQAQLNQQYQLYLGNMCSAFVNRMFDDSGVPRNISRQKLEDRIRKLNEAAQLLDRSLDRIDGQQQAVITEIERVEKLVKENIKRSFRMMG